MKEYSNVFSWSYKDLKACDTSIIQHTIPIKKDESQDISPSGKGDQEIVQIQNQCSPPILVLGGKSSSS